MIDLHCHLLPNVDDGSSSVDISLELAKKAVSDGITHALLTPHHMNGQYINHKQEIIEKTKEFQKQLIECGIQLTVFPCQEVRINENLIQAIDNDDILFADEGNHYLMLEFPDNDVPLYTKNIIYQLSMRGITPIIVHPERNTKILNNPDILTELINLGCLTQLTAASYLGVFGRKVKKFSKQILKKQQVTVIASDTHDLPNRESEVSQAMNKIKKKFDDNLVNELINNSKKIINGESL